MKNMENMNMMGTMIAFAGGMAMGLMYSKYERKINRCIRSMMMKVNI